MGHPSLCVHFNFWQFERHHFYGGSNCCYWSQRRTVSCCLRIPPSAVIDTHSGFVVRSKISALLLFNSNCDPFDLSINSAALLWRCFYFLTSFHSSITWVLLCGSYRALVSLDFCTSAGNRLILNDLFEFHWFCPLFFCFVASSSSSCQLLLRHLTQVRIQFCSFGAKKC